MAAACGGAWRRRAEGGGGATVREGKKKGPICLTADGVGGYGSGGATVRGEGAGRVKAQRWRGKGEPMRLSYFHTF
jgi:hypothetical protein